MPVPFETLLPYAIMIGMFGVTGTGLAVVKTWRNEGKRPRYSLDQWDRTNPFFSSDGPRSQTYWHVARADRQARSTTGVRILKWLEAGKALQLGTILNPDDGIIEGKHQSTVYIYGLTNGQSWR
ncbi:hypothetical protein MAC_03424 [Metarhizium acridum CQMa 102]|uniref:NADH dehydrogenase [ubiquinone] 1 alpha subcomplex subunit 1 n=1 Tax=Metarhizium acridum (strain CQMa 102) TaxID=655827 RepID=E9E0M6_METAQ|nr:uncharacterized protein MAC_03424 [Metarhizium acridum CQMa 102]EFY90430.1 hypothetical protein MAC_03424 [Metarhizium acridum CQMa 102]